MAVARETLHPRSIAERVRRDHETIRALLDEVERACTAAKELRDSDGLDRFRAAVWDLYTVFDEHRAMEEAHVAPLLRATGAGGEARAVDMILEHNEQRRIILELVEDTEREAKTSHALLAEAAALLVAFRADMTLEELSLAGVLDEG